MVSTLSSMDVIRHLASFLPCSFPLINHVVGGDRGELE